MQDKNEILAEIEGLRDLFNEKFDRNESDHAKIIVQTTKTNGRVCDLEGLKNKILGALVMTNLIILPVVFILLSNWLNK